MQNVFHRKENSIRRMMIPLIYINGNKNSSPYFTMLCSQIIIVENRFYFRIQW